MTTQEKGIGGARSIPRERERPGPINWPEELSTRDVSPAAGSAAAVAAGMGVALLIKLARRTRPQDIPGYNALLGRLLKARDRLLDLAEADASALRTWLSTRKLDEDNPERLAAIMAVVQIPLEGAKICRTIRCEAEPLLTGGYRPARPDGEVGTQLLQTSQQSLRHLAQANAPLLRDLSLAKTVKDRLAEL